MRNIFYTSFNNFVNHKALKFMIHRGEIVEKVIRGSGYPLTKLADKLKISRRTIYNKLEDANLDYEFILKVGRIIHHDFTEEFPTMFNPAADEFAIASETSDEESNSEEAYQPYKPTSLKECERELISLQRKYISLMESHMDLLKQKNQE